MNGYDFSVSMLVSTGRISSEILHKVKRCGIPLVLSRGMPTHQTVLMARDMGITVIGFARGGSLTIYSHPERVTI
jgi:FdhD protein